MKTTTGYADRLRRLNQSRPVTSPPLSATTRNRKAPARSTKGARPVEQRMPRTSAEHAAIAAAKKACAQMTRRRSGWLLA